ncbi:hypothetical protein JCM19235_2743 [Vibrio maritimus]|uniref:Uncharacterized protein n=1 Tax=Vibrio maritimus TaxID=990268 RepID=A0A090S6D5_9VIBR|nr:hypothetical protein JCM19235_2743 [Vibrio maritimus]
MLIAIRQHGHRANIVIPLAARLRRQGSTISVHQASTKIPVFTGMTAVCVSHNQQPSLPE